MYDGEASDDKDKLLDMSNLDPNDQLDQHQVRAEIPAHNPPQT